MRRLVLIDGKSVFYRGYYAMGPLSLADGTPTGGVYGFAAIAMEIVEKLAPTKVVVAWDSPTSASRRRAIYPGYKAGRIKPGEDFYTQIPLLRRLVERFGWSFVELENYEADDIIGTLARQATEAGNYETFIISSDLDMLQIVDDNTHLWRILKGFTNIEKIHVPELEAKYGIKKSQFLDLKSLKGDSSDNIPGVPGIGEKTAAKLLQQYGTLDNIYANLSQITGATATKLTAGRASAYLSKSLAQIIFDAPIKLSDLPDFHFDPDQTIAGLRELEFNSLIRKFTRRVSLVGSPSEAPPVSSVAARLPHEAPQVPSDLAEHRASRPDSPLKNTQASAYHFADLIVAWDIKSLMHDDATIATRILGGAPFWDLSQAAFLLDPLARHFPELIDAEEKYHEQLTRFQALPRLYRIYTDYDLPLIPILYQMERKGMLIDPSYFESLEREYGAEVRQLERQIFALSGREFNLNSPFQLSDVLFDDLGLPTKGIKKTARGFSTGAKELEKLQPFHPIVNKIIEYREAAKLLSTYIAPIPTLAGPDGRIHTTFTQNVTATGRLSSKDPNLQNIPVRTSEGKRIRAGFIAPQDRVLVSADYSQFELRLAAILSGDQDLIADFNSDIDVHSKTASEAFHIPLDQVTKDQRRAAKVVNFGILYGMSVKGLADAAKMPISEAKSFIDNYFRLRAPIKRKLEQILAEARENGFVETYYGRRRPTPDVRSSNFLIRQAAERAAANMPIQGTEADLMKRAMIRISHALPQGAELIMQVHDSLIVECDEKIAPQVGSILKSEMESVAPELAIKLAVDVTTGRNWGEL